MATFIFAQLTIREAQRRRILWVALLMGIGFLTVFGVGFHYVMLELEMFSDGGTMNTAAGGLLAIGLYATSLLVTVMTVLVSVTTISGEIDTHTIETLLTKPVRRWEVVLGKWLAFMLLLALYLLLLAGGLMLFVYLRSGITLQNVPAGLGLMLLQGLIVLSVTILGGTRLSTLANGVLAFMLFGIAFLGSWIEQIGALFQNETAVDIGIITSLLLPNEVLWRRAVTLFLPEMADSPVMSAGPFVVISQPSPAMVWYALFYTAVLLLLALFSFSRRDL